MAASLCSLWRRPILLAIKGKDPLDFIDTALGLAGSQSGKQCLGSLESNLGSIKKWLTFGKVYTPLVDSSDLDFDKLDVASVPEIMQVRNLFVILIRNAMSPPFYAIVYTCKGSNQRQRNQFLCSSFFFFPKRNFFSTLLQIDKKDNQSHTPSLSMAASRIGKHRRQLSNDPPSSSIALNFFLLFFP